MKNGDLLLRVCELQVVPTLDRAKLKGPIVSHRVEHGLVTSVAGLAFLRASSGNWSGGKLSRLGAGEIPALCSREPVIELSDGSLGISAYFGSPATPDRAVFVRSFDGGNTWGDLSVIAQDDAHPRSDLIGLNFNETAIADLGQGRMIAMIRCDESFTTTDGIFMPVGGVGSFHTAYSFNSGLSWSRPKSTEIFGQPAHLLPLSDGRVLCTYGYRKKPYGIRAIISYDRGMTWDMKNEIILRDDGLSWDLGYPMTLQLSDGAFFTVYYMSDKNGIRYIEGTRWVIS
ncbi:MAG: exo-alpha-sialidase [Proteobacteria bacterium]|nr:MAG: exo-alpha-sialidase [Pseudomonadota bacterium]